MYLPEEVQAEKHIQPAGRQRIEKNMHTAVMDMYALLSFYLIQAGFSSVDDPTVRDFLFTYVRQYKHGEQLEEQGLLGDIPEAFRARRWTQHSRALEKLSPEELQSLVRYTWPDNYRALRQYVRKTIVGILRDHAERRIPAHQLPFYTIALAAKLLGTPRTTLYRDVNKGKIQTKQEFISDQSVKQLVIPEEEFRRLEEQKRQREQVEEFLQAYADISGIQRKSVKRQEQRLKKQGNSAEVSRQHLRQKAQRCLQDSDT